MTPESSARVSMKQTIGPLAVSSLAATALVTLWHVLNTGGNLAAALLAWPALLVTVTGVLVLVVPLFVAFPGLRRPPALLAMSWGGAAALFVGWGLLGRLPRNAGMMFAFAGVMAGLLYASLVGRRPSEKT